MMLMLMMLTRMVKWMMMYAAAASCGEWLEDIDFRIHHAMKICKKRGYFKTGSTCILVTGSMEGAGWTNTVRTIIVPDLDVNQPEHYVNISNQKHLGI